VPKSFLVASFSDADSLMRAVPRVRREHFRLYDVFSPYPVHGLDEAMGIRRTRLPFVTLFAGLTGLTFAVAFQFYGAVFDWPLNVGGKPDESMLAFVPISFELTVLLGALGTVAAFFVRARLSPGKRERLAVRGVTSDMFALVLRWPETSLRVQRAYDIFEESGAHGIEELEAQL
jgi:hypothetical protein